MQRALSKLVGPYVKALREPDGFRKLLEIKRLRSMRRFQATTTHLLGKPLHLVDAASFLSSYQQICENEIYHFSSRSRQPLILDCGANIGLAVLFWKQIYPGARVIAFEPDPGIFQALERNCREWRLENVQLKNKAVWTTAGELPFWPEGADGGRLLAQTDQAKNTVLVPVVRLRDYLQDPVDLLKLDIEGAETAVLLDCADHLKRVERVFVEYHSFATAPQSLDQVLNVLRTAGFRVHVQPELVSAKPFMNLQVNEGMDQRLNIFAFRGQ